MNLQGWKKGVAFVNGQNLGRYWSIGPQQTLYLPGPWLKTGMNQVCLAYVAITDLKNNCIKHSQWLYKHSAYHILSRCY